MTAKMFAEHLKNCAPPLQKLQSVGMSLREAESIRATYICNRRTTALSGTHHEPLLELIENYDLSQVDIGSIRFTGMVERGGRKWPVGTFASDLLVLDPGSGQVEVEEFPSDGHLLWECAHNGWKERVEKLVATRRKTKSHP